MGEALRLGKRATGANMWAEGRRAAPIPIGDIEKDLSPYPFLLILGQDDNERLLGDPLRNWGLAVQRRTELVALAHAGEVEVGQTAGLLREWAAHSPARS